MNNILFISHSGYKGGAQYVLEYVVKHVCTSNNDKKVYLIYPKTHGSGFNDLFKGFSVKVKPVYFFVSPIKLSSQLLIFFLNIPSFFQIAGYILFHKIDIIYINSSVNLMPLTLAYILNRKTIFHIHENSNDLSRVTPKYTRWIYRLVFKNSNIHTLFVSNISKSSWEQDLNIKFNQSQYTILYSPVKSISFELEEKATYKKIALGFMGSITKEKNIDLLLRAIHLIQKRNPHFEFSILICGDGPYIVNIKELTNDLKLNDNVFFMSAVANVGIFFSKIDILVQPSINESWGLVALEAMIAKKPVLMTNRSGLRELFLDKIDCLYFDPTNSNQLSNMIESMQSRELQIKLSGNAYKKLMDYEFNDKFNHIIDKLLCLQ